MLAMTRSALLSMATLMALALAPAVAHAATIAIDDLTEPVTVVSSFGTFTPGFESVTGTGQYISADPTRPILGASRIFTVNLVSDGFFLTPMNCFPEGISSPSCLSDTLKVTVTGIDPTSNNGNNVSVSLEFVSVGEPSPPFLPLGDIIPPGGTPPGSNIFLENGTFQHFFPLADLDVSVRSDCLENISAQCAQTTPEPASLALLGAGLIVLAALRRRKAP